MSKMTLCLSKLLSNQPKQQVNSTKSFKHGAGDLKKIERKLVSKPTLRVSLKTTWSSEKI